MKTIKMAMAAFAVALAMTARGSEPVVVLKVGQPKLATKVADKWKSHHSSSCSKEITKTRSYAGSVGCVLPKGEKTEIGIEAFFVTSQMHGGAPQVSDRMVVELFEFGDGSSQTRKFSFVSPETKERKEVRTGWGYDGDSRTAKRMGEKYLGVIVRAVIDGKVVKVVSVPNNAKWNAAAKEDTFILQ